ncbi:MAG: hypothetical protein ACKOCX_03345 [Planctomycetota bacterium]
MMRARGEPSSPGLSPRVRGRSREPAGIWRTIAGDDVRVSLRFRFSARGMAGITVRGVNPIVDRDFHVAVLHIRPASITATDNVRNR